MDKYINDLSVFDPMLDDLTESDEMRISRRCHYRYVEIHHVDGLILLSAIAATIKVYRNEHIF